MSKSFDVLLLGGKVFTGINKIPDDIDIGIKDGFITELGNLRSKSADQILDCKKLIILPGVIDTQVHFREPGMVNKENIASGSRAAVKGGVTAFCEMPNTNPLTVNMKELSYKLKRAELTSWCDYAFFVGATSNNIAEIPNYEKFDGCAGIKIFMGSSTGELLINNDDLLFKIMSSGSRRVAVHAEDESRLQKRYPLFEKNKNVIDHPKWRDEKTAYLATKKIIEISKKTFRKLHLLHVSTGSEMEILKKYKKLVTLEVTPQHLILESPNCYKKLGTFAQMNPPIRDGSHRKILWENVNNGIVDVLGSDHAPHTIEEKRKIYPKSPSGMPGVQTMLPIMLDQVSQGNISLSRIVSLLCTGPSKVYNMHKRGYIKEGYIGSLSIVDMNLVKPLLKKDIESKCGWSPFENKIIKGWPVMTIINGCVAMKDGKLTYKPLVRPIKYRNYDLP